MAKVKVSVSIDHNLLMESREQELNLSGELESTLRAKLEYLNNNLDKIKFKSLKKIYESKELEYNKLRVQIHNIKNKIELINKKQLEDEENRLKELEKQAKNSKTCLVCKNIINDTKQLIKTKSGGMLCRSCFMSGNDPTKW